jgi:CoA:oxalate CoA-transferase
MMPSMDIHVRRPLMPGPLEDTLVLDLSWVLSGPFCSMVLSDLGATVIKIEHPDGGDKARGNGPYINDHSAYFMSINRGKRSIVLDLNRPHSRAAFLALVKKADVLLENFRPGVMDKLDLGYQTLKEQNPRLIYTAISGFGQSGPYAQRPVLDVIVQGMGGMLSITGEPGGPPVRPGASFGDLTASLYAAIAILAAINERHQSGLGQMVDISMLDCQVAIMENAFSRYFATGETPGPLGTRHPVATPFEAFQTADGYIVVAIMGGPVDQWPLFCAAIDRVDLIDDERFLDGWSRARNYAVLKPSFDTALIKKSSQEWLDIFSLMGIACGPVNTIDRVVDDPQVRHREMFVDIEYPRLGKIKAVNSPIKMSRTAPRVGCPAPELGENSEEILREILDMDEKMIQDLQSELDL